MRETRQETRRANRNLLSLRVSPGTLILDVSDLYCSVQNVQIRLAASIESAIKDGLQPSDDSFLTARSSHVKVLQPFIQKHKPQQPAPIVISPPTQPQSFGNSAPSVTQAKASASGRAFAEEGASSTVSQAGSSHVGRLESPQRGGLDTGEASLTERQPQGRRSSFRHPLVQRNSSILNTAVSRVRQSKPSWSSVNYDELTCQL